MTAAIVIPTYNEAANILPLCRKIASIVPAAHVLIVDDNSPDNTADIARKMFQSEPLFDHYRVLQRQGPRGLGRSLRDGLATALAEGYDLILQMDADGSHHPEYLPALIDLGQTHDLVIGSRYCAGGGLKDWPWQRRMLSRFANAYVHWVTRMALTDATAGLRCWSRAGLSRLDVTTLRSEGYAFQVEMSYRAVTAGLRCIETPIIFTDRQRGKSKISRKVLVESMWTPWALRYQNWHPADSPSRPVSISS